MFAKVLRSKQYVVLGLALSALVFVLSSGATTTLSQAGATAAPTQAPTQSPLATMPVYTGTFDGTILFGAPLSLTGSLSKEGNLSKEGYEIWKTVYNQAGGIVVGDKHYKIDTKYYDDTSDAQKSATLADKLINEDKINFLLGPYGTSATLQVSTVAEKNKMPMVEGNGTAESIFSQGYQYSFLVGSPAKSYLLGVIDMALAQDPKPATVAILSADDPFSVEVANSTQAYAQSKGLQIVYFQKYPANSADLRAPLTEAKGKTPDMVINSGHFAESVAIMQQAKELGFNAHAFAFSVGPSLPDFQTTLKADSNYVFGGAQWTPDLKYQGIDLFQTPANYNALYQAQFGHNPAYQSADATASGIAYVQAIEAAGTLDPKAVRDAIAKLDFISFYGQIKFDERGVNIYKPMVVQQWQNGSLATVWPPDVASAKPMWPAPDWDKR